MARIVIRCQYTGHYVFTGFDTQTSPAVSGGHIFCPYCVAEHVWSSTEARLDDRDRERRQKPMVRHPRPQDHHAQRRAGVAPPRAAD